MKRRNFLQTAAAGTAASLPFFLNGMPLQTMAKSALFSNVNPDNDKVLVLIQLIGGNDGLNTIIPLDQYAGLAQVRGNIMIPEQNVLSLTDTVGVHPGLSVLRSLYEEGKAGVVQAVGYPNQNRSHFRSMDIWNSGSGAEETWSTGWLGRYLDSYFDGYPEGYPNEENPHSLGLRYHLQMLEPFHQATFEATFRPEWFHLILQPCCLRISVYLYVGQIQNRHHRSFHDKAHL